MQAINNTMLISQILTVIKVESKATSKKQTRIKLCKGYNIMAEFLSSGIIINLYHIKQFSDIFTFTLAF